MKFRFEIVLLAGAVLAAWVQTAERPLAVFVIGTPHYDPARTLPKLARQLEMFGFRTLLVGSDENPEYNPRGLKNFEAIERADVAIFYVRFLTVPEDQLAVLETYLKKGKPVVGIRTSTHAFDYPASDPRARWNQSFGKDVLGGAYLTHLEGTTTVTVAEEGKEHPILTNVNTAAWTDPGTLYIVESSARTTPLLIGEGQSRRSGTVTNKRATFTLEKSMRQAVAWTSTTPYGGRVFTTTLGNAESFGNSNYVRLLINGIHWAVGKPVPPGSALVAPISIEPSSHPAEQKSHGPGAQK